MSALFNVLPWPYRWLALAVLSVAVWGWGWLRGAEHGEAKLTAYQAQQHKEELRAAAAGAAVTAKLAARAATIDGAKDEIIHNAAAELARDVVRLRQRPARHADVPALAAACTGASGAELAARDAEFLSRYSAAAAELQADDDACHAKYNAALAATGGPQ